MYIHITDLSIFVLYKYLKLDDKDRIQVVITYKYLLTN